MKYSPRVADAMVFAYQAHKDQTRKQSPIPYIAHPLAVASLVATHGGVEDQFIGALLHDTAEDQGGKEMLERVRAAFGDTVARLVEWCSDTLEEVKPPWRQRKEAYIRRTAKAPEAVRLIVAADKLDNAKAILRDFREFDDEVFTRFTGGKEGTLWYYENMLKALESGWDHPILDELSEVVNTLLSEAGNGME